MPGLSGELIVHLLGLMVMHLACAGPTGKHDHATLERGVEGAHGRRPAQLTQSLMRRARDPRPETRERDLSDCLSELR